MYSSFKCISEVVDVERHYCSFNSRHVDLVSGTHVFQCYCHPPHHCSYLARSISVVAPQLSHELPSTTRSDHTELLEHVAPSHHHQLCHGDIALEFRREEHLCGYHRISTLAPPYPDSQFASLHALRHGSPQVRVACCATLLSCPSSTPSKLLHLRIKLARCLV
jgi:hypothetical protein